MENLTKLKFKGKIVLVTGSGTGIGRATAIEFAKEGATVIINCVKNINKGNEVVKEIKKLGGKAFFIQCDISNEKQVIGMVKQIIDRFKKIDILVNNAGITKQSKFLELTVADFQKTLNTNLLGTFICLKHVAKEMINNNVAKNKNKGKIVNVASIRGLENCARRDMIDYSVSKAGVINLTKSLAKELTPLGININAVAPAITETELVKNLSEEAQKKAVEGSLIKRMAKPEEIAKAILFLASEDANYITGEVLVVDGGYNLTAL